MRFIHLSDLHIGRQLHQYNLKEDQEHILGEVVEYAKMLRPDAIVIAGDVYDKSVPSAEAVGIFDSGAEGDLHCRKTAAESGRISQKSHISGRIRRGGFLSSPVSETGICKNRV